MCLLRTQRASEASQDAFTLRVVLPASWCLVMLLNKLPQRTGCVCDLLVFVQRAGLSGGCVFGGAGSDVFA
jgi:hypothetical protein